MYMSLGHVYIVLEPVGSASLTSDDDRYYEFMCFDVPKVVQSPGCDHGHDEDWWLYIAMVYLDSDWSWYMEMVYVDSDWWLYMAAAMYKVGWWYMVMMMTIVRRRRDNL